MSRHPLTATLDMAPVVTGFTRGWRLTWQLAVGEGIHGAGPAGPSRLQFDPDGVTVWSDYAEPARLLQVDVPFGLVADRPDDDVLTLQGRGGMADADAEVVEALLGVPIRQQLTRTDQPVFVATVDDAELWSTAGRAALLEQLLADRHQPVSGLWALELAEILTDLSHCRAVARRRDELVGIAEPALAQLPVGLADIVTEQVPELAHLLLVSSTRHDRALGPVAAELQRRDTGALLDELRDIIDAATQTQQSQEVGPPSFLGSVTTAGSSETAERGAGPELPSFRGHVDTPMEVRRDFSVEGLIREASARRADQELTVTLKPAIAALGAVRRLHVRVTADGELVAASVSFALGGADELASHLLLPPGNSESLDVVVGRDLPLRAIDGPEFQERQATHHARRFTDALRLGRTGRPVPDAERSKLRAVEEWSEAGRADLAALVEDLAPQVPFVTERAVVLGPDAESRRAAEYGTSDEHVAGARDLAWSFGDVEAAGQIELLRRKRFDSDPLPSEHHDTLTLTLAVLGHVGDAADLDALAPTL